jgi:hypothetical protein
LYLRDRTALGDERRCERVTKAVDIHRPHFGSPERWQQPRRSAIERRSGLPSRLGNTRSCSGTPKSLARSGVCSAKTP